MKANVIILTGGLSGSSVLCGLIAQKGYWLGEDTKKIGYQTFENSQLIELNIDLLHKSGYSWDDTMDIPPPSVEKLQQLADAVDNDKYQGFIQNCNIHNPWLWKDPRLCYTIFFWGQFFDLKKCKFILMHRNPKQSWIGIVLRGKTPIAYKNMQTVEQNCIDHARLFLKQNHLDFLDITFEDLMLHPDKSIARINEYLGIYLTVNDLDRIYKGKLYKLRWETFDFYKAQLKFFYYRFVRRDATCFPRKREGRGSGYYHIVPKKNK